MYTKPKQSFTLIELLIVIAIIGILAAAVIFGVKTAVDKSRDSRRLEDINNIAKALHSYYLDNGSFPKEADGYSGGGSVGKIGEGNKIDDVIKQYMGGSVPRDPLQDTDNTTYYYYYDGKHACTGGTSATVATVFVHKMQDISLANCQGATCILPECPGGTGSEGGGTATTVYKIILGPSSG